MTSFFTIEAPRWVGRALKTSKSLHFHPIISKIVESWSKKVGNLSPSKYWDKLSPSP